MMKLYRLLFLALLASCAHGYGIIPEPARATDHNAKRVRDVVPFSNEYAWRRSVYWRPSDNVGEWPWDVIIADDYTACVSFGQSVFLPLPGNFWNCPTQWRLRRP